MKKVKQNKIPKDLQEAWRLIRGEEITDTLNPKLITPISTAIAEAQRLAPAKWSEGHGIFLGEWQTRDKKNLPLRKKFNVFAAPEDLTLGQGTRSVATYMQTVKNVSRLVSWHGFNGTFLADEDEIIQALNKGTYRGEWVIPPFEILIGIEPLNNQIVFPNSLFALRHEGNFVDTYYTQDTPRILILGSLHGPQYYWSSTKYSPKVSLMGYASFAKKFNDYADCNHAHFSCRPVRFEEIKKRGRKA